MITVVIADDQRLVRTGFRLILDLEPDMTVVGEAGDGSECVAVVAREQPDVVLMDVRMPFVDGIEATRRLTAAGSTARVLVLTTFDLDEYVYAALQAGASGFLLKDAPREQLISAIRQVTAGEALLAPSVTKRLIERFVASSFDPTLAAGFDALSERERQVLLLIGRGYSNAEIAHELFIGDATVKTHVARLLGKLGARDRIQAIVLAYECGFLRSGSS
jgi:DNA-binding NarL/FixJ family response regulator